MIMKNSFLVVLLTLLSLTACNDAKFNRYPGTKLDSIPLEFRGVFMDPDKKSKTGNVIFVEKNYWMESNKGTKEYLSDSMVLSVYKGAYYLSTLDDNQKYWYILHLKTSGKDLLLYPILYDDKKAKGGNSITKYFTPQLDTDSNYVFTMDEEKLLEYTANDLMKEESMKLKRAKPTKRK